MGCARRVPASRCGRSGKPRVTDRVPEGEARRSPSASTAATSSTATRTAWRSASAASCAPACARPAASTCAAPTTRPTTRCRPGERYGFVYEINYLRCIHCDLCVEACPTEAITETKLFEFSFTNRQRRDLHQGRAARRRRRPAQAAAVGAAGAAARTTTRARGCARRRRRATPRTRAASAGRASSASACAPPEQGQTSTDAGDRAGDGAAATAATTHVMEAVVFFVCAVAVLVGALGVVLARNPVHSALVPRADARSASRCCSSQQDAAAPRRRAGDRLRRRDRRAVPVRDHAARRRPARDARDEPLAGPAHRPRSSLGVLAARRRSSCSSPATAGSPARTRRAGALGPRRAGNVETLAESSVHRLRLGVRDHRGAARDRGRRRRRARRARSGQRPGRAAPDEREHRRRTRRDRRRRRSRPTYYLVLAAVALHDRRRRPARAPQRARDVHVRRADAQRREPHVRHLRPRAQRHRRPGRSCSSCWWSRPPRSWSASAIIVAIFRRRRRRHRRRRRRC